MRYFFQLSASVIYQRIVKPILFKCSPDAVHDAMVRFAEFSGKNAPLRGFVDYSMKYDNAILAQKLDRFGGLEFTNPFGLGAGFDKNALTSVPIEGIGLSFATFGSTTARECQGNARPWFHRLPEYKSLMVNAGLANRGVDKVSKTVEEAYLRTIGKGSKFNVGLSIARTNDAFAADDTEGISDYATSLSKIAGKCAFVEVNISCPNTFKGEPFVDPKRLDMLLTTLDNVKRESDFPVTLKMPSDKTWDEFKALLDVIVKHNVQAVTIANLRKDRNGMDIDPTWKGNLSGKPTENTANNLIKQTYKEYGDKLLIFGLGGVFNAADAYEKILCGASLVEIVTVLMFKGPAIVPLMKRDLAKLLKRDGYSNISEAIGKGV